MKKILFSFLLFYFFLLSTCFGYIPHNKIVEGFSFKEKSKLNKSNISDAKSEFIKSNLIPIDQLIPVPVQKMLDKKKEEIVKKTYSLNVVNGEGIDLRKFDTTIKRQWNGTCTAFGLIAAMENYLKGQYHLSERDFWAKYERYSSAVAIKTAEATSFCEEKYWQQNNKNDPNIGCAQNRIFKLTPGTKYLSDNINKAMHSLDKGYPVYIAMTTPSQMAECYPFIDHDSGKTGGGHALAVVGYRLDQRLKSGGYLILKNSWGNGCGDKGYQYLDFDFCQADGRYCLMWSIDNVEVLNKPSTVCTKWKRKHWWKFWTEKNICAKWENVVAFNQL